MDSFPGRFGIGGAGSSNHRLWWQRSRGKIREGAGHQHLLCTCDKKVDTESVLQTQIQTQIETQIQLLAAEEYEA